MVTKEVPTLDPSGKIFDKHLPDRLRPDALSATNAQAITDATAPSGAIATAVTPVVESAKIPSAVLATGFGGPNVTNSKTGVRTSISGAVANPVQYGVGVKATIDGAERWVSPSGYPRPVNTSFMRSSLWGSSSAANLGPKLRTAIAPLGMELHYETGAVGSFQMTHIAAAIGIRPLLAAAFTIPASGGVPITPTNMPEANNTAIPVSWPGSFAGIPGTLSKAAGAATWTFTRSYTGTATAVPAGAAFTPLRSYEFEDGVTFLNLGKNTLTDNTYFSYDQVVDLTEKAYDFFAGAGRHVLMLGHYQTSVWPKGSGGFERLEAYNKWCKDRYGARFVDIQAYLSSPQVWTDTGITPTAADLAAQAYPQSLPPSLQLDNMHLNAAGGTAVANLIAAKLNALGWTQSYAYTLPGVPAPALAWNADTLTFPDGYGVGSWASINATQSLINSAEAKSQLATTGANRYLVSERADAPFTLVNWADYGTVIGLVRVRNFADLTMMFNMGPKTLYRSSGGQLTLSAGSSVTTPMPTDTWGVAAGVFDGASARVSWNTTVATGNCGTGAAASFQLSRTNDYADIDYAAVLVWTEKLDATQVQAVVTALKAAHPALLP